MISLHKFSTTSIVLVLLLLGGAFLTQASLPKQGNPEVSATTTRQTGFLHPGATQNSSEWNALGTVNALNASNRDPIYSGNTAPGNYLKGVDYNVSLPDNAIVTGIEVMIEHATWNGNNYYANLSIELQWNGMASTTNTKTWDYVDGKVNSGWNDNFRNVTLGSSTNTWGRSWSPSDLSNSNFAVRISLLDVFPGANEAVDIAWVNVHYQLGASISLDNTGDRSVDLNSTYNTAMSWSIAFGYGVETNLAPYLIGYLLINGTEYNTQSGRSTLYNNSAFALQGGTSLYEAGIAAAVSLDSLIHAMGTYNITLVTQLPDNNGNTHIVEHSTVFLKVTSRTTTTQGQPFLQIDPRYYTFDIQLGQQVLIAVQPAVIHAAGHTIGELNFDVLRNGEFINTYTWQNNTASEVNVTSLMPTVGFYNFTVDIHAQVDQMTLGATVVVQVTVSSNDSANSTMSTNSTTASNSSSGISTLGLNLDAPPLLVFIAIFPMMVMLVQRKRKLISD